VELWRETITGTGPSPGQGRAIVSVPSPSEGVVVAGSVANVGTGEDFIVAKLSTLNGSEIWRTVLDGSSGSGDEAADLARFDGGDVAAAGRLDNTGTNWDFTVARLAGADGAELWRYTANGTSDESEEALAVTVDGSGDVVAAGFLRNNSGSSDDLTVVKLAGATGTELWRREITGSTHGSDQAFSVATDSSGDVFVGGFVTNATTGRDLIVLKLSGSNGSTIWRYETDGGVSGVSQAAAVATDDAGKVFAAGRFDASGGPDLAVVALNASNGTPLWTYRLDGPAGEFDDAHDLVVGADGDPVVVGYQAHAISRKDLVAARLDATNGSEVWRQVVNGNANDEDEGLSVAVTPAGSVLVGAAIWRLAELQLLKKKDPSREFTVLKIDGDTGADLRLLTGKRYRLTEREVTTRVARFGTVSRDGDGIEVPPTGSPSDPRTTGTGGSGSGGEIVIRNPSTGEIDRLPLPAQNWKILGTIRNPKGYRYFDKDGSEGPCRAVILRTGRVLRINCPKPGIDFTLDEPSQGSLMGGLVIGETPVGYCLRFGGVVLEDSRRSGVFNRGAFRARDAPIPPGCTMELP
jgi:outer membrane protein assembly factor BamB